MQTFLSSETPRIVSKRQVLMIAGVPGTRGWHLAKALHLQGYFVTFVIQDNVHRRLGKSIHVGNREGIRTISVPTLRPYLPWEGVPLKLLINIFDAFFLVFSFPFVGAVDIVYSLGVHPLVDIFGFMIKRFRHATIVVDVSDTEREALASVPMNGVLRSVLYRTLGTISSILYSSVDAIVGYTQSTKSIITAYTHKEIHVVYNVVDTNQFSPIPRQVAFDTVLSKVPQFIKLKDKFVVLYAGIMGPLQDLERVISAAKVTNSKKIVFLFVGEGEDKKRLKHLANELQLNNVLFINNQPWELMASIINCADLCLLPLRSDPMLGTVLPKKIFEYSACGKPIISFCPRGEVTSLVQKWQAGMIANPEDPEELVSVVHTLSTDKFLIQEMGHNARKMAEASSLKVAGENLERIFDDSVALLERPRVRHSTLR
jgi:glycosyltransferase involved in cell wall biosynthesis